MSLSTTVFRHGRRHRVRAVLVAVALTALTACGGTDQSDAGGETTQAQTSESAPSSAAAPSAEGDVQTLTATEDDFSISLDQEELTAGEYEIEVVNDGGASHDLIIEQDGEDVAGTDIIAAGESATLTVTLEPGEYVFYCSVANHRGMGMEIAVTVS